ncbi:MAG: hypothetical protein KAW17_02150, partial [Candidatus Eisenbacteria sp.]|nr:hypothetical protein [Candidatus Eisenbacteria bacterium]
MRETYVKGVATHHGPESWVGTGDGACQALAGEAWTGYCGIRVYPEIRRVCCEADGGLSSRLRGEENERVCFPGSVGGMD